MLLIAAVVAAVVLGGGGSDGEKPVGQAVDGKLAAVPTNQVTGSGDAVMRLHNNNLTVSIDTTGLLNGAPHALHIHAGGKGTCPDSSVATKHNGHLSIATHAGRPVLRPAREGAHDARRHERQEHRRRSAATRRRATSPIAARSG